MKKKNPIYISLDSIYRRESRGGGFWDKSEHVRAYSSGNIRAVSFNPSASVGWSHLGFRLCRTTRGEK